MNTSFQTKIKMSRCSQFQKSVYNALLKIPRGKVTTYKILAQYLSATGSLPKLGQGSACGAKCGSCRAVGQALRRNPFAPNVPCHRVIASDLGHGGYKGNRLGTAIRQKLILLEKEGVKFTSGHLAEPGLVWRFNQE